MRKRILQTAVGFMVALSLCGIAVGFYLAFFFPKTVARWAEEGRTLSVAEQVLVRLSQFFSSFGLLLFPVMLLVAIAGIFVIIKCASATGEEAS